MHDLTIQAEHFQLHADKGAYWPRERTLFIADTHFGKDGTFRRHGIPVPEGGTGEDLDRLTRLLQTTHAERLVILGDFFHARAGRSRRLFDHLLEWRRRHAPLAIDLVPGNHDVEAGPPPRQLDINICPGPHAVEPFVLTHVPVTPPGPGSFNIAGHLHPAVRIRNRRSSLTAPCFYIGPRTFILPAFGSFTGTSVDLPDTDARIIAIGPDALAEIPPHALR